MNIIPRDIKLNEFYKHLSYDDIVRLCQTNAEFNLICQSNSFWQELLKRDFNIVCNAQDQYLSYKRTLNYLSKYYPIVTSRALHFIMKFITGSMDSRFDEAVKQNLKDYNSTILSFAVLGNILDVDDGDGEYIMNQKYRDLHILNQDPNLTYPTFDLMIEQLEQNNCDQFRTFITNPTLVFVKGNPVWLNYDYELASEIPNNTRYPASDSCYHQLEQVKNEMLALI